MFAEKPKKDKQLLAENIWLLYFNDVLYRDGIITQSAYHKMIHRINSRNQTVLKRQKN
jgi:hypothetical protein